MSVTARLALALLLAGGLCARTAPAEDLYVHTSGSSSDLIGDRSWSTTITVDLHVDGAGTLLAFDSLWDNGASGSKTYWRLDDAAKVLVTGEARINNNMPDLIHARDFRVLGSGGGEVLEFAPEFNADLGTAGQPAGGLSTLGVADCTLITNATRNLPSIHKYVPGPGGPVPSHHGLLTFRDGPGAVWQVRTADQSYDGGIYWQNDWTLDVAAELTFTFADTAAERAIGADVGFGTYATSGTTLTKLGGGTLHLAGAQGYRPDTTFDVREGTVHFSGYDPTGSFTSGYLNGAGQYLALDVAADAAVRFEPDDDANAWGVERIASAGTVEMGAGRLGLTGDLLCAGGSALRIALSGADAGRTKIRVAGAIDLDSGATLEVLDAGGLAVGTYPLLAGAWLDDEPTLLLPPGVDGWYAGGVLEITAVGPGPGDADGDGDVDAADYRIVKRNWGRTGDAGWADGDFNGDGSVGRDDLAMLRGALGGESLGSAGRARVPAPGAVLLLAATVPVLLRRRAPRAAR